jgi:MoaA/NifB/PqqE/SkfB family radical SAM enzyme
MVEKGQLFCSKPFRTFVVGARRHVRPFGHGGRPFFRPAGDVFMCCWLRTPTLGNILYKSIDEVWNGEMAQETRRSILDGSFQYCDHTTCPFLQTVTGEVQKTSEVKDEELETVIKNNLKVLPYGPKEISCSYDRSCNLSCPSCRKKVKIESAHEHEILEIQSKIEVEGMEDCQVLIISGSGDPFGSPYYRRWLQTMNRRKMLALKQISLHTNGQLWTCEMWSTLPEAIRGLVRSATISIDAARAQTYSVNRRGGSFEKLLENLELISQLRACGPLEHVKISMVVQNNNYEEMHEFVHLGKQYNCDVVYFSKLLNRGTFSAAEYRERAIHLPDHPRNSDFMNILKNDIFRDPIVQLGNLTALAARYDL